MKTTKRVLAIVLAVLMLALTIPFAASAVAGYSLTINCDKDDYTYTVYKIADFDETTGHFNSTNTAVQAAISQSTESTADVLAAADASTFTDGTEVSFDASNHSRTLTGLEAGMYYIKCTKRSIKNTSVAKNNIVPLPNKEMAAGSYSYTVDVALNKIVEGDEPGVTKKILDKNNNLVDNLSVSQDDTITYVLTADVKGTVENKYASYMIGDDMDADLDTNQVTITSVALVDGTNPNNKTALEYDKVTDAAKLTSTKGLTYDFGVAIRAAELEKNSFYGTGNKVEVIFTTKLVANPTKIGVNIPNTDGLKYSNKSGNENEVKGNTVNVYTFKVSVNKVDADSQTTKLKGAVIGIYRTRDCSDSAKIEQATTGDNGVAAFTYKFAEGTYYVKEISAPNGYNLNKDVFEVVIAKNGQGIQDGIHNAVTITDTKAKLPETGGAGTIAFTIIGGALVAAAGVLLVIVLKKRSAK